MTGYSYNSAGRLIATRAYATAISPLANYAYATVKAAVVADASADRITTLTLDAGGRVITSVDPESTSTYYTYDLAGRVIKVRHGSNAATQRITRNWYDARGNLIALARQPERDRHPIR